MILWYIVAAGFISAIIALYYLHGIVWSEVFILVISSGIVFSINLNYVYKEVTTDHYVESGYITSKIHRPSFSYKCGKDTRCYEPELWILEQFNRKPKINIKESRNIEGEIEECFGECYYRFQKTYRGTFNTISVNEEKFNNTEVGSTAVTLRQYYNPVNVSDEVIYSNNEQVSYFTVKNYNKINRLIAPKATAELSQKLEELNAKLSATSNISVGLIITDENLLYEKLKRAWHNGKANDFIIIVYSPNGEKIKNVNILGWNNHKLKENIANAIMALPSADIENILATAENTFQKGPLFTQTEFAKYNFLNIKIPSKQYWKLIVFQFLFFGYMISLLRRDPNTKTHRVKLSQILKMWNKKFRPPHSSWNYHPLTPQGIFLYIVAPTIATYIVFIAEDDPLTTILKIIEELIRRYIF